ncbi:glutaredoxin, GrxB family [Pasteurellaceae bacterium RH1A]|nr:glutaredoxin, GrxB family [Pasteurellaceae bacterium RH1A]
MKLYIYEGCPFCVRARMIFGLKNLPVELVILQQDDDLPVKLVGKKTVPILETDHGQVMPESLDIVSYVDGLSGQPLLTDQVRPAVQAWADKMGYVFQLYIPRSVELNLPEHQSPSAKRYYIESKTERFGDFAGLMAQTPELVAQVDQDLAELEGLMLGQGSLNQGLSLEDILVFPTLRSLTAVKGLSFPAKLQAYVEDMSKRTGVALFSGQAI